MATSDYTSEIPYGYCKCGCGQKTTIAKNNTKEGVKKGEPYNYVWGHFNRGINFPDTFWSQVNKNGSIPMHCPELGNCWEWTGSLRPNGYGQYGKKRLKAHRVAWEITYGEMPKEFVLHKCDNPKCVNPEHLFLGTQQTNMDDKVSKGRQNKGETSYLHKLTDKEVVEIRYRYENEKITQRELGIEYGVTQSAISDVTRRKNWKG